MKISDDAGILSVIAEDLAFRRNARHCVLWHQRTLTYRPYRRGLNRCEICGCKLGGRP